MKDIVILGNGFDLSCQLRSKYADFFNARYVKSDMQEFDKKQFDDDYKLLLTKKKKYIEEIYFVNSLKEEIEKYIQFLDNNNRQIVGFDIRDTEYNNKINKHELEINETKGVLKELKEEIKIQHDKVFYSKGFNFWDYWFMYKAVGIDESNVKWSDVESSILNMLKNLEDKDFNDLILFYVNYKNGKHLFEFFTIENYISKSEYKSIYEFLLSELHQFEYAFLCYLREQVCNDYFDETKCLFKRIVEPDFIRDTNFYIINFNYTNPFSEFIDSHKYTVNNVHGSLEATEIIFGIDKYDELPEELNDFTKTIRIMSLNNIKREPIPSPVEVKNIYFFGHSLSEADYSYFLSIFDYYDIYSSDVRLIFCYKEYDPNILVKNEEIKKIDKLMTKYGKGFDNKAKGRNLLHKLTLENRLLIKNIN